MTTNVMSSKNIIMFIAVLLANPANGVLHLSPPSGFYFCKMKYCMSETVQYHRKKRTFKGQPFYTISTLTAQ